MDLLKVGSDWLQSQRAKFLTRNIVYVRDAELVEIPATVGKTIFRVDTGYGRLERLESRDYLVTASELILGGQVKLPEAGDCIRETDGPTVYVYEVMAPGNEPVYRYSDPYRKTLRIHTKLVSTEPAT